MNGANEIAAKTFIRLPIIPECNENCMTEDTPLMKTSANEQIDSTVFNRSMVKGRYIWCKPKRDSRITELYIKRLSGLVQKTHEIANKNRDVTLNPQELYFLQNR